LGVANASSCKASVTASIITVPDGQRYAIRPRCCRALLPCHLKGVIGIYLSIRRLDHADYRMLWLSPRILSHLALSWARPCLCLSLSSIWCSVVAKDSIRHICRLCDNGFSWHGSAAVS
jgi:hypothetical protein